MIYVVAIYVFFTAVGWLKGKAVVRRVDRDLQIRRKTDRLSWVREATTLPLFSLVGLFYMLAPTFSTRWMIYGVVIGAVHNSVLGKPEAKAYLSREVPESPWQDI